MGSSIVVTGATGFIGRHLLEALGQDHDIWALSRVAPGLRGVSLPASARWIPVDVAQPRDLRAAVDAIVQAGGAEILIHLAGHYDFTGERNPEYLRTNVEGLRNVLEVASELGVRDFVFASSVAACAFPPPEHAVSERSPPAGDTPYAESKRAGGAMLAEHRGPFRRWIVRFAAVYSDWCEYEPLYRFLETWLSRRAQSRILAGSGLSAIPYLHVRDAVAFIQRLIDRRDALGDGRILLASPDGATSHLELFEAATGACFGERSSPILLSQRICRSGLWARDLVRRTVGSRAFERPWMGKMIDLQLAVNAERTRKLLDWAPRARLGILRRIPFLIQNRKGFEPEWQRRNRAALKGPRSVDNLRIVAHLERRQEEIADSLTSYVMAPQRNGRFVRLRAMGAEQQRADSLVLLRALAEAVRTGEKALFRSRCQDLARRRRAEGLPPQELTALLDTLGDQCVLSLTDQDPSPRWSLGLYDHITMTVQFGIDDVLDVFEEEPGQGTRRPGVSPSRAAGSYPS